MGPNFSPLPKNKTTDKNFEKLKIQFEINI